MLIYCVLSFAFLCLSPFAVQVDWSDIARYNELLKKINFWVFSVGAKLVPCILLTYLSLTLIRALIEADKRKRRLKCGPTPSPRSSTSAPSNSCGPPTSRVPAATHNSSQSDRTTRMLVAILLLFLLTEFPSGILVLLSGIIGDKFFQQVYTPLGELLDILALINSAINFILYCSMSAVFRQTFVELFCFKCSRGPSEIVQAPSPPPVANGRSVNLTVESEVKTLSVSVRCDNDPNIKPTPV